MTSTSKPVIVLSSGYEVDTADEDWPDHLLNALVGEVLIAPVPSWDARMALLVHEVTTICANYGLSLYAWVTKTVSHLDALVKQAEVEIQTEEAMNDILHPPG